MLGFTFLAFDLQKFVEQSLLPVLLLLMLGFKTYQGLTTCMEVDKSWTIMSSAYNHVRSKRGKDECSMAMFIRKEVEH